MNFIIIVMSYTKIYFKIAVYNDEFKIIMILVLG